jgi:hypothetical protein
MVGGQTFRSKREASNIRACCKDRMGDHSWAQAFIVPCELIGENSMNAMKFKMTSSLVLVPCLVCPSRFTQDTIKSP